MIGERLVIKFHKKISVINLRNDIYNIIINESIIEEEEIQLI